MRQEEIRKIVDEAETELASRVSALLERQGKFEIDQYARFLSMQYHLTTDVQQEFFSAAGNHGFNDRKPLRRFLTKFAEEEEPHYNIAKIDLESLGRTIDEAPIDVMMWKNYFDNTILERPCIRIGATCVLENIANKAAGDITTLIENTPELGKNNTRFIVIHMHGDALPHGDEIMEAVEDNNFTEKEQNDLVLGARIGKKTYLQLVDWIITGEEVTKAESIAL